MTDGLADIVEKCALMKELYPSFSSLTERLSDEGLDYVLQLDVVTPGKEFSWRSTNQSTFNTAQKSVEELADGSLRVIRTADVTYPPDARENPGNAMVRQRTIDVDYISDITIDQFISRGFKE